MGVRERQERERQMVARAILDAAREMFVRDGYDGVSIRRIAERIEYSPAAIYSYFPSKDDILVALATEGFQLFLEAARAADSGGTPVEAIRRRFWSVYEFSKTHPEYFALMFLDRSVTAICRDWQRFGFVREMENDVGPLIQAAIDDGDFPPGTDPDIVLRILSTAIHGAAAARLCDRLMPGEEADALARDTLEAALTGLRAGFATTFEPVQHD